VDIICQIPFRHNVKYTTWIGGCCAKVDTHNQVPVLSTQAGLTVVLIQQLLQPFNGLFSRTTWVSRYQKGKTNLDFTGARDSEWQWHQLDHMQVCTLLQTDNHASTPPLCFLQAGCPSCRPTNSIKALKADCSSDNLQIIAVTLMFHLLQLTRGKTHYNIQQRYIGQLVVI